MKKLFGFLYIICFGTALMAGRADSAAWKAGICVKKFAGFYLLNGVAGEFSHPAILQRRLQLGLQVSSSSLGTGIGRNAIAVHIAEIYGRWPFRPSKKLQPFVLLNAGYAQAFFGSSEFRKIPSSAFLISPELGCSYQLPARLQIHGGIAYQVISGNGLKGPGFIYPLTFQFRLLYRLR